MFLISSVNCRDLIGPQLMETEILVGSDFKISSGPGSNSKDDHR